MSNRKTDRIEKPKIKFIETFFENPQSISKTTKANYAYAKKVHIDTVNIDLFAKALNDEVEEGLICCCLEKEDETGFSYGEDFVDLSTDSFVEKEHYRFNGTLIYPFGEESYQQDLKWINEYKTAKGDLEKAESIYNHIQDYSITNELAKYRTPGTSRFPPQSLILLFIAITILGLSIILLISEYDFMLSDLNLFEYFNAFPNVENKSLLYQIIAYFGISLSILFFFFVFLIKRGRVKKINRAYESLESFNIKQNTLKSNVENKAQSLKKVYERRPFWWDACHFRINNNVISFGWFQPNQKGQMNVSNVDFNQLKNNLNNQKSK